MSIITSSLLGLIEKVAVAAIPGAPAVIDAGKSLVELVQAVAPTLAEGDQRKLQEALPGLLAAMNSAVDQAIADLGGHGGASPP